MSLRIKNTLRDLKYQTLKLPQAGTSWLRAPEVGAAGGQQLMAPAPGTASLGLWRKTSLWGTECFPLEHRVVFGGVGSPHLLAGGSRQRCGSFGSQPVAGEGFHRRVHTRNSLLYLLHLLVLAQCCTGITSLVSNPAYSDTSFPREISETSGVFLPPPASCPASCSLHSCPCQHANPTLSFSSAQRNMLFLKAARRGGKEIPLLPHH